MYPLSILKTYIMKLSIYLCVFLALLISCKQETKTKEIEDKTEDIKTIISNLDTNEKKEAFLIELHDIDQGNRGEKIGLQRLEILKRNNYNIYSQEYLEFLFKRMKIDSINTVKAMAYLDTYGYPEFGVKNNEARRAINLILMHQPTYEKQLRLFPYVYQAFKNDFISADSFSFLLNNMHRHRYGKSYPHALTNEENIKQLLEILPTD